MSLYDRLDLTKHNRKLKLPLSQRLNLTRTPKLCCHGCRSRIQPQWEFCPSCGRVLIDNDSDFRRCIWVDVSGMDVAPENKEAIFSLLMDAFSKLYGAFRSIKVFLTSDPPDPKEWGEDFTHVYIFVDSQPVDYLGVASFKSGMVTDRAIIRIDQVFYASYHASLSSNQLSNLIANTIAHEIGHTLGLDHSALPTDVMHNGLVHTVHSLMPPSFHAEQINSMNNAIRRYKALNN
jgi:hypothetical protein